VTSAPKVVATRARLVRNFLRVPSLVGWLCLWLPVSWLEGCEYGWEEVECVEWEQPEWEQFCWLDSCRDAASVMMVVTTPLRTTLVVAA